MTPQERQLVDELFDRLAKLENAPRDPDAAGAISQGLRRAPNAVYALVQTALLQDEALKRANNRIQELEASQGTEQQSSGGFLDTMRETLFGSNQSRSSVPNVRPPESRPVWNSGGAMPQGQPPGYAQPGYGQPGYGQPGYGGAAYGSPPFGGGGSFLGTAAAAAAGMVGGSLLLGSIRNMMGGPHQGFGDANAFGNTASDRPWSDQSGSTLAQDAGLNDIGSDAGGRHHGLFDQASNDDPSNYDDGDNMDGGDDFGNDDGGSDYA